MSEPMTTAPPPERFFSRAELMRALGGICSETLRRQLHAKRIPEPDVNLSRRTQAWKLSSLRAAGLDIA